MNFTNFKNWPKLKETLEQFTTCKLLSYFQDPGYGYEHVFIFKCEFTKDKRYGLFIWDTKAHQFIEEPATLADYDIASVQQLHRKYPSLRTKKC